MGSPQWGAKYRWGRLKSAIFDQYLASRYAAEAMQARDIVTMEG